MGLLKMSLGVLAIVCSLAPSAPAAQKDTSMRSHLLSVHDVQGATIPGLAVSFEDGNGNMVEAVDASPGVCTVWEMNSKLKLEVTLPGQTPQHIEVAMQGTEDDQLELMVDQFTGELRFVEPFRRSNLAQFVSTLRGGGGTTNGIAIPVPMNDDCVNARVISGSNVFLYSTILASNDGPDHPSCFGAMSPGMIGDVWFCWTAPCTGTALVSNCFAAIGNSRVAVYDGCACPTALDDPIACSENDCGTMGRDFQVTFPVVQGQEYLIRIGNFPFMGLFIPTAGAFVVHCEPTPDNDLCENATPLNVSSGDPVGSILIPGTTIGATVDMDAPFCGTSVTAPGVWYDVIGTGYEMEASTCDQFTNFDTKLSVYCRDCGPGLTCVTGNDDDLLCDNFLRSSVSWCSQEGAKYRILVHGFGGATGDFKLKVSSTGLGCELLVRCRFRGACCDGEVCNVMDEEACDMLGGTFYGDLTDCCGKGIYDEQACGDAFEDIAATGNDLALGFGSGTTIPIGFGFDYFGEQFFNVGVSSSGYCVFGPSDPTSTAYKPLPSQDDPDGIAAAYWFPWDPGAAGSVSYETRGVPGARRCIVQWTNVPLGGQGGSNTFQAVFYEGSNEIHYRYGSLSNYLAFDPPAVGIENKYGSHGYGYTGPAGQMASNTCLAYVPRWAPICAGATARTISQNTTFSYLDGGAYDLDGTDNGVFKTNGLIVNANIHVDVPYAKFDVQGDLTVNGSISSVGTTPLPVSGPVIEIKVCESMWINNGGIIRSYGTLYGGTVSIYTGGDFHTSGIAGVEAHATATYGSYGGWIEIITRGQLKLETQGFLIVKGEKAGHIDLDSCDGSEEAIFIRGKLNAGGWGPYGCGGQIYVTARQGGIYMAGTNSAYAAGQQADGAIYIKTAWIVTPTLGPWTTPDADVIEYWLSEEPCDCEALEVPTWEDDTLED